MQIELRNEIIENTAAARFLETLDNQLKFEDHTSLIRGRMEKANDVFKYVSNVTKGPEIGL